MKRFIDTALAAAFAALVAVPAAADTPAPSGVVNLSTSATAEVPKDWMSVVLTTVRDGSDASAVQSALKQALDVALTEARRAAKPGQLEVQTGNFSLYPRYTNKGVMSGWQGTAELLLEGRDMPAIGQLVGRIDSMTISRVNYSLSRDSREKLESEVAAQAIARYRDKAADYARQFGYAGYTLREVNVTANEPSPIVPMQLMRVKAAATLEASPLPVEAGKALVTVGVSGSVQLNR
jgi:predicted secreted protein